jgi:heat shock protein HslJ
MSNQENVEFRDVWKKYLLFGLVFLLLTACTSLGSIPITGDEATSKPISRLSNTKWRLVSFGWPGAELQAAATPVIESSTITLEFDADGQAGGFGGCNHYSVEYVVQENMLSFGEITRTLIACEEGIGQQEKRYFQALETAGEYELAEDHLVIWYSNGQGVLYFVKWLKSVGTPTAALTAPATTEPTGTPIPPANPPGSNTKRIDFETGATSATVTGNLQAFGSDPYVLYAFSGQTITVELSFTEGKAILASWGKNGTVLLSDHAEATHFQEVLPSTQDYYILLKGRPEGSTDYRMKVTIPPLGSHQPTPIPERINFEAGDTSATVTGSLLASGSDSYVLRALEGQTMTVELSFTEGKAILAIWAADGTVLMSDHAEASPFSGILPSTQDYYILVKGRPDGETDYSMKVVIPPLE